MEGPFYTQAGDMGLVINLVREANIVLASLPKDSPDYIWKQERFEEAISVMRSIEYTEPQHDSDINFILKTINTIWEKGILSPLTLKDDEFDIIEDVDEAINKRYKWIIKQGNKVYNNAAYKTTVRKSYNHNLGTEVEMNIPPVNFNPVLYISKGGVITGEYICRCEIRPDIVAKHSFVIQSIINIPSSIITINDRFIYVVDHREPKLKILNEFYNVPVGFDNTVKNMKLNIRNYKKLKI